MSCTVSNDKLHALVTNGLPPDEANALRAHALTCPRCAPVLRDATAAVEVLRQRPISALDPVVRTREILRALDAQPARRRPWHILVPATVVLAAALVVVLRPRPAPPARVTAGSLEHALTVGVPQLTTAEVTIELTDGSRVQASRDSRFTMQKANRWEVTQGELRFAMQKQKEPFVVATAEVTVTVVGTQFAVERVGTVTHVAVEEGRVQVDAKGERKLLGAGEVWPAPEPREQPTLDQPLPEEPTPEPTKPTAQTPRFDAAKIRARIAAGRVSEARTLIATSEKTFADSLRILAELKILTAEADLAERQYRPALDKYLAVVRDFPTTPQAEQALFAAAQLAFDEPAAGYQPALLLKDYLATYPRGKFRHEAERLLRTIAK